MRKPARRSPRKPPPAQLAEALTEEERAQLAADEERLRWSNFFPASLAPIYRRQEALKKQPIVVSQPPLPALKLTLNGWVGTDVLKSWAGFGAKGNSKGKITLGISRAHRDRDDAPVTPAKEMVAAYAHLKKHELEVRDVVLAAVQSHINDTLGGESAQGGKPVRDPKSLKRMMELDSINVLAVAKKGMSYVGLLFQCTWDPEHAAGVLLHGSRVIAVGDNGAAGDEFAAMEDGGKRLRQWKW